MIKFDKNPIKSLARPEVQALIGRNREIYEKYGLEMSNPDVEDYEKSKMYTVHTHFYMAHEYCIPESVSLMHRVEYFIYDYVLFDDLGHTIRRPRISMNSYLAYDLDKPMLSRVHELADSIHSYDHHYAQKLCDQSGLFKLYTDNMREDVKDMELSLRIGAMLEVTAYKLHRIGYERIA